MAEFKLTGTITKEKSLAGSINKGIGMGELPSARGLRDFLSPAYSVNGADLTSVGEAIAEKAGVEKPVFPDGFVEAVEGIEAVKVASGSFILTEDIAYVDVPSKWYHEDLIIDTGLPSVDVVLCWSEEWVNQTAERPCFGVFLWIDSFISAAQNSNYPYYVGFGVMYNATTSSWYGQSFQGGPVVSKMNEKIPSGSFGIKAHSTTYPLKAGHTIKWIAMSGLSAFKGEPQ